MSLFSLITVNYFSGLNHDVKYSKECIDLSTETQS